MKEHHNGIHHISVLAGYPQRNADFYINKMGLRMVKKSVNQDDPGSYHLLEEAMVFTHYVRYVFSNNRIFVSNSYL